MARNKIKTIPIFAGLIILAGFIFSTCETPMGLGPPVDTNAPTIFIDSPVDNYFLKGHTIGAPIELDGTWFDDKGVSSLKFEIYNRTDKKFVPFKSNYSIGNNVWTAGLSLSNVEDNDSEYTIFVYALDKFGNEGGNSVNVRIEIVPPWVENQYILRHPRTDLNIPRVTVSDKTYDYYLENERTGDDVKYRNSSGDYIIDAYQNEAFTLQVDIMNSFSGHKASRLNVYVRNSSTPIIRNMKPDQTGHIQMKPKWTIKHSTNPNPELGEIDLGSIGYFYLEFEVLAWSDNMWNGDEFTGSVRPEEEGNHRVQRLPGGTLWMADSDKPKIWIDRSGSMGDMITVAHGTNLPIEFYDDDRIQEIRAGLLTRDAFDTLRQTQTEAAYLKSLETDSTKRTAVINALNATSTINGVLTGTNTNQTVNPGQYGRDRFTFETDDTFFNRWRQVSVETATEGEYILIALVNEWKKTTGNYDFYPTPTSADEKWTAYPYLRVQVQDYNYPIIVVEKPERDNMYPPLTAGLPSELGEKFILSGYVLDATGIENVFIGWAGSLNSANSTQIGNAIAAVYANNNAGTQVTNSNARLITDGNAYTNVWKTTLVDTGLEQMIGSIKYKRYTFEQVFHVYDDFYRAGPGGTTPEAVVANLTAQKALQIRAVKTGGTFTQRTFRIAQESTAPSIEVTSHGKGSNHDRDTDLKLSMRVNQGRGGVKIKPGSQKIYDTVLDGGIDGANNAAVFTTTSLIPSGNDLYREILTATIKGPNGNDGYAKEADTRDFRFEAENILGQKAVQTITILMSNRPMLESITCSNGSGTYGIGTILRFEANFSMAIRKPAGNDYPDPKLLLYKADTETGNPAVFKRANFIGISGNTAAFEYVVADGDDTESLYLFTEAQLQNPFENPDSILAVGSPNTALTTMDSHDGSLQKSSQVKLDGVRPKVLRASFEQLSGAADSEHSYFNNGKNISIKLYMSEQVQISGAPEARIQYGTNPNNILSAVFTKTDANESHLTGGTKAFVVYFTHTLSNSANDIELSQLMLSSQKFKEITTVNNITDVRGNQIDVTNTLTDDLRRGDPVTGMYRRENASIKTTIPPAPTFTLHTTQAGAQADNNTTALFTGDKRSGNDLWLRIAGLVTTTPHTGRYSLQGGNYSQLIVTGGTPPRIEDGNYSGRFSTSYTPSNYSITAWQVDIAGNQSTMAPARNITINSRWPELNSVDFGSPDGSYPNGTVIPIKINLSRMVNITANTRITLNLDGTRASPDDLTSDAVLTSQKPTPELTGTQISTSTMITVDWVVNVTKDLTNIKLVNLTFTNLQDEFGNDLGTYSGTAAESSSNQSRPVTSTSSFQINRPSLSIFPNRPTLTSANPAIPTTAGNTLNGSQISANAAGTSFTMTFTGKNLNAVPGNNIVIRPYGNWAIPPVLSVVEFDSVLNGEFRKFTDANDTIGDVDTANRATYQKNLSDVDASGMPVKDSERGSNFNLYLKNTHGLSEVASRVRPDTGTKMVLDFETDLFDATANSKTAILRNIFNSARWKWQIIGVTTGNVTIGGTDGNVITITLPNKLDDGRIWEVIVPEGSFQDAAGNQSVAVEAGKYRFWSRNTAQPVIRVEKVSYDANNFGNKTHPNVSLGFISGDDEGDAAKPNRPPADTRVRIDCETPGADIRYSVIRTSHKLAVANGTNTPFITNVFTGTNPFLGTSLDKTVTYTTGNWSTTNNRYTTTVDFPHPDGFVCEVRINSGTTQYWLRKTTDNYVRIFDSEAKAIANADNTWETGLGNGITIDMGYHSNNTVGNDDVGVAGNRDTTDNFFLKLLVPGTADTASGQTIDLANNNGTFAWSSLTALDSNLTSWAATAPANVLSYRTIGSSGGETFNTFRSQRYIFIGDAYNGSTTGSLPTGLDAPGTTSTVTGPAVPGSDAHESLYKGRRDYIVAAAKKSSVTSNATAGPALDVSAVGREGVYKTTLLYRQPRRSGGNDYNSTNPPNTITRLLVQGFDQPVIPVVAGFPLRDADSTNSNSDSYNNYFSKSAYRLGTHGATVNYATRPAFANSHYMWVSWEMVTDWYQKGKGYINATNGNYLRNELAGGFRPNANSVAATYGGIIYRHQQDFW